MQRLDRTHFAAIMLFVATAAWAMSFSLGKDAGGRLNDLAGLGHGAFFGPTALQGARFVLAAVVWFAVIPMARRGWSWGSVGRGLYAGMWLGVGIVLQHLALDRTSPAATAFLTALTVLWVPLIFCVVKRRLPAWPLMIGVMVALGGLYLMLGEGLQTFRTGEMLGLGCSVAFAFHLLAVSSVMKKDDPWRMCGAQFVVCGAVCLLPAMVQGGVGPAALGTWLLDGEVAWRLGLILAFPTFVAFGLMNYYQHRVDSTRATLIYQAEPVMAAGFDWAVTGRGLTPVEMVGAVLILGANLIAELWPKVTGEGDDEGGERGASENATERGTGVASTPG